MARQIEMEQEAFEVVLSGSIFEAGEIVIGPLREVVLEHCPRARLMRLNCQPVVGAVILGMEQVGFDGYAIRDEMRKTASEIVW